MTPPRPVEDGHLKRCILDETEKTQESIQKGMDKLARLWDEVHMQQEARLVPFFVSASPFIQAYSSASSSSTSPKPGG